MKRPFGEAAIPPGGTRRGEPPAGCYTLRNQSGAGLIPVDSPQPGLPAGSLTGATHAH